MGHIDLARFIFYKGAYGPYGREIDAIARRPLWQIGLDYRHGTGHGVGAYLSVHEGMSWLVEGIHEHCVIK